jgi:hypothetical protein
LLLLFRRTSLLLLPVTVNIVAFHLAHDMPGNGIWVVTSLLHVAVLLQFRSVFTGLIGYNQHKPVQIQTAEI